MNDYDPFHSGNQEWVELDVEVLWKTEMAIKIEEGEVNDVWIPLSQIKDVDPDELEVGQSRTIEIPEWLAEEKGLI